MMISSLLLAAMLVPVEVETEPSIDSIIDVTLDQRELSASEVCSDSEFLRRVSLDLIGRIPTTTELNAFLENPDRSAKVDELLQSDEYPLFMSQVLTAALVGYLNNYQADRESMRTWLFDEIRKDTPYDELARQMITASGTPALDGPVNFIARNRDDPVVKVGRMFLGVRLDCAQCHDHPFDRWTQEDYQQMRRFFAQIRTEQRNNTLVIRDEVRQTDDSQRPTFLTGARPRTNHWRAELALYVSSSKPFARTFGNRVWYHLMGRGIVEPIDDFNASNSASIPELVEFLADSARASNFSLKEMIRLICNSRAYQRASGFDTNKSGHPKYFAARSIKPMMPEQYVDSVNLALDLDLSLAQRQNLIRSMIGDALQEDFNPTWEYRETIQVAMQRLAMPLPNREMSVEELYLRILSRKPTTRELETCSEHTTSDIAFALINSNEFFFNH